MMDMSLMEDGKDDNFIRSLAILPEKSVFLSTEKQLNDISRFCTDPEKFPIFGIDLTFNVGPCYVTLSTYRQLHFKTKLNEHPVMIGPCLIHTKKEYQSYFELPSNMLRLRPELSQVKVIGTDSEKNLFQPFLDLFDDCKHLLCDLHMNDNVFKKAVETRIPRNEITAIMQDVFGHQHGNVVRKGLIQAESEEEFDGCYSEFQAKWSDYKHFIQYFHDKKVEGIKNCMRSDIRSSCGLGYPPKPFTQNANECMNRVVKSDGFKRCKTFVDVVKHLKQVVSCQDEQEVLSLSGQGEWHLDASLVNSRYDIGDKYFLKTPNQRRIFVDNFNKEPAVVHKTSPATDEEMLLLSVTPSQSGISYPPFPILNQIFVGASDILKDESLIVKYPGQNESYLVGSNDSPSLSHTCSIAKNRNIKCDCKRYKSYSFCQHTIALAEKKSFLGDYLNKIKNKKQNLNTTVCGQSPINVGEKKKAKATQRRKTTAKTQEPGFYESPTKKAKKTPIPFPDPLMNTHIVAILDHCPKRTTKCFGCCKLLRNVQSGTSELVVVGKAFRPMKRGENGELVYTAQPRNVYFHLKERCVKIQDSSFSFDKADVFVQHKPYLTEAHKQVLNDINVHY